MTYTSNEMVAQCSAIFPIFRGHARQRGRGFGSLAQTLGRTALPLIAAPDIGEVVSGRKKLKTFAKDVGTKTVRKQLAGGKKKSKSRTRRAISRKSSSKISRSRKDIFDKIK